MKKILIVTVVPNSSIDRLSEDIKKHNEHLDITIFPFHAKRHSAEDLLNFEKVAKDCDLIDFEYWRGADVLLKEFPWLKDKKKILAHHNPYDLDKIDINLFDDVVVKNKTQLESLPNSIHIPHGVNLDFFEFNEDYDVNKKTVGMVAFRIEGKKGIREVAQVCKKLGYKFVLIGHVSKPDYMKQIMEVNPDTRFREDVSDEDLRDAYKEMSVLVCNSVPNFESGSMPILEAMASGVPVLTREVGLVPDIYNEENMMVRGGLTEDVDDLEGNLKALVENKDARIKIREKAWQTVKNWDDKRMAMRYAQVYNKVLYPNNSLVSIITATYNRKEQVLKIIESLNKQTYKNIELIIADDNSTDGTESAIKGMREKVDYPIKYVNTNKEGYNLAMVRNMAVIESDGEILFFLDSRLLPKENAIEEFVQNIGTGKTWLFGDKGAQKKSFVENFSMIRKKHFVRAGMCNERVDAYGGMSQELRERFKTQNFNFTYVERAKADQMVRSGKMSGRRKDIREMKLRLWRLGYNRFKKL